MSITPYRVKDLLEAEIPTQPCWINPGILPKGGMLIAGGEAKLGKTFTVFSGYAKALALKENLFNNPDWYVPEPAKTLVIEQELGPYILQKRIKSIFADSNLDYFANNLWVVSKEPELKFDNNLDGIRKQLDSIQPNVLICDPIAKFHSGNENDAQVIEELIFKLSLLLREYRELDLSIIFTHHYGKPPQGEYANSIDRLNPYNFRGSSKWFDAVDTAHTIIKTKNLPFENKEKGEKWTGWEMKNRYVTRAGEPPPDFFTKFNEINNQCVLFDGYEGSRRVAQNLKKFELKPREVIDPTQVELFDKIK